MDRILEGADTQFENLDRIPDRSVLTFSNGFYVQCSALFVDIRESSTLPEHHNRPVLAKIYRAYLSEVVAAINGTPQCQEVSIVGDSVSGIFDVAKKGEANHVVSAAARAASVVDALNYKMTKRNYRNISVGIGVAHGTALMVKAGYSGSGINEIVWMGDVVNLASNLCGNALKTSSDKQMLVSESFYERLSADYQAWFSWNSTRSCYQGRVINTALRDWLREQS